MSKTLIVRACAIGDFVLNLPALQALHKVHSDARFTLVGYPSTLELAKEFFPVEGIYSIETAPWPRLFHDPIPDLQFDSAVVWMKDPVVADNLRASGIPEVLQADPFPTYGHAADHLLRTLQLPAPPLPDLWQPDSDDVIIHPGSGSPKKNWAYFEELASRIPGSKILLGPGEGNEASLPLPDVLQLLRHCRCYIGNDSGITHLAAYAGCPSLALFGPTDPRMWGPIGRRSRVIWKAKLEDIRAEEVLTALEQVMMRDARS